MFLLKRRKNEKQQDEIVKSCNLFDLSLDRLVDPPYINHTLKDLLTDVHNRGICYRPLRGNIVTVTATNKLIKQLNKGQSQNITNFPIPIVCDFLQKWLQEMELPLIEPKVGHKLNNYARSAKELRKNLTEVKSCLEGLGPQRIYLLKLVLGVFRHACIHQPVTLLNPLIVGYCLSTCIFGNHKLAYKLVSTQERLDITARTLAYLVSYMKQIFGPVSLQEVVKEGQIPCDDKTHVIDVTEAQMKKGTLSWWFVGVVTSWKKQNIEKAISNVSLIKPASAKAKPECSE